MVDQEEGKSVVQSNRRRRNETAADILKTRLPDLLCRSLELASEKGSSSWLFAPPVEEHGFALHKESFRHPLCLRYNWLPSHLPTRCVCGESFTVDHSLNCPTGGYPTLRHNELRDLTANLMSEVCHDVCIEPPLQPLTGESMNLASANREDGA